MATAAHNETKTGLLRTAIEGTLVEPGEASWDEARRAWNLAVDQQPGAVGYPEASKTSPPSSNSRAAKVLGSPCRAPGTARRRRALERHDPDQDRAHAQVEVDPDARTARSKRECCGPTWVGRGRARSRPVGRNVAGRRRRRLHARRRPGLARAQTRPRGEQRARGRARHGGRRFVRADRDHETDLFWALRGGGGSLAIVDGARVRAVPGCELYAGALFWPVERAGEILDAWREWVETVPDELDPLVRLFQLPPIPDVPEPLRGPSFVASRRRTSALRWMGRSSSPRCEPLRRRPWT